MRMLFVPERHERGFDPIAKRLKPVDPGMASCTQRDEISSSVDAWPAMMDDEFPVRPTGAATAVIAVQNVLAMTGETAARVSFTPVTSRAKARAIEPDAAAAAE